jgi:F-type H+-transporting ATPase subunit b
VSRVFEVGTFVVSIVSFLIVFWIIAKVGFKPLAGIMEKRRVYVTGQLAEAEHNRLESERILAEQKRLLEQTRKEAKEILDAARMRADEQSRNLIRQAEEESARILAEGRQLIQQEREEALNAALQRVAELTVELTTKLLHNYVTAEAHAKMLQEAEEKLGELAC